MKKFALTASTLAAELLGVLLAYPGEFFAPGELAATLRACPAWNEYLTDFETDRGQPAAIGRYLNELGLTKSGHHRTRGSLYSSQEILARLQQVLEEARRARAEQLLVEEAPDWEVAPAPAADDILQLTEFSRPQRGPSEDAVATETDRTAEPILMMGSDRPSPHGGVGNGAVAAPTLAASATSTLPANPPKRRRSGDETQPAAVPGAGTAAAAAPARSVAVIGWRRRATDQARSSRPEVTPAATEAVLQPPPSFPMLAAPTSPYAGYPPGGMASGGATTPVWVGGGAAGYSGGVIASYGIPYGPPTEFAIPGIPSAGDAGLPLAFYWTQIRRHLYKIVLAAVLVTTLVGLYTLRIPKLYESVVTLRMDFKGPAIVAEASNNPDFDPTTLIQTEVTDVTQRGVILGAITKAHLDQNTNLLQQVKSDSGVMPTTANPDALDDALVGLIASQTTALSPTNTNNIDIHYKSLDPATAATVANAVAVALIAHEFQTRQQEQDDSLKFMTQQFKDIQARMELEQAALTVYQHQNNILNPDGQSSLENTALNTLQANYLAAQSELTKDQAEENILKQGEVTDTLLASSDGAVLRPTYDAWRTAQLKFDQVKITRGAANPEYKAAADGVATARAQLDTAILSVKNQLDSQYQRAQNQEMLVRQQLDAAREAAQSFNDKAIDYNAQKRDLDADQKLYDDLLAQIKQQQLTTSLSSSGLRVTNLATPNPTPVYPSVRKNVMLALLFSLFFGCGLAVMTGYLDRSFTSPEGVEQYLGIPLLGALPILANKANPIELAEPHPEAGAGGKATPRSAFAEAILLLRTAVLYGAPHGVRTLCITSAEPQEGKSLILANLAIALALHGSKVLLVDGDIRRPTQHRIFDVPNLVGLSSLLRQTASLDECFRPTTVERLYIMPAGPAVPNPSELVATMLAQVLAPLSAEFDYVLVDSPPLLGFADAVLISTVVEGTLLVARAGKTQREMVHAALRPLRRVRARVLGLILNQVSSSLSPYYSYFRDHYARHYGEQTADGEEEEA